jgi:ornithine decarboxylase
VPTAGIDAGTGHAAAVAWVADGTPPRPASPTGDAAGDTATDRPAAGHDRAQPETSGWWRAWRARFGLAEVCGTAGAVAGFAAGYLPAGSVLSAAALATVCEVIAFYGCVGTKTALAACRATAHLAGWRRLAAGGWHAVKEQLASCAVAEALDDFLIRPGCMAGAAWLLRPLPGGVWLGFVVGKAAADVAWYGMEASARWGVTRSIAARRPATPYLLLDLARARESFQALAAALPGMAVHYAVKANPHRRLLACLHRAGCRFEAASWAEVRAVIRAGVDPATVLFTHPVKPAGDIARAGKAGVWRFAADSDTELHKIARHAPGSAVLLRLDTGAGGTVGDQGKFGVPPGQVVRLARLARSLGLDPYGLAFHVGSQMMDPKAWDGPIRQCAQIMTTLAADGIRLAMLDVGGGFPVRYDTDPPPLAEYATAISSAVAQLPYPVALACEPGRAIAAPAGTMVTSVIGAAWRRGTLRVSLDVGAFHGLIEALESGRELRFPVAVPAADDRTLVPCTLTGPSCDSQDTILDQVWLPSPEAGDRVLIGNSGAYTTCYSGRSTFNGYPAPAVRIRRRAALRHYRRSGEGLPPARRRPSSTHCGIRLRSAPASMQSWAACRCRASSRPPSWVPMARPALSASRSARPWATWLSVAAASCCSAPDSWPRARRRATPVISASRALSRFDDAIAPC